MTSGTECSRLRILLGVYVLGAIEPAERAMVDAHLGVCVRCRDELASLAGLPAMLGRVTEDQLEQLGAPPEELLDSILTKAAGESRGRQRKNRLWLVAAAAALVVVTGVGVRAVSGTDGGTVAKPLPSPTRPTATASAVTTVDGNDPATGVRAEVGMQPKEWGTAFSVRLAGAPAGSQCRLIAIDKQGRRDVAGGWKVEYLGEASFYGSSMFQKQDIASVEIRTLDGKRLLHVRV
jgi:Predicted transmembrane transcriptional regulator (anti-sigma factor)